nr:Stf0 sulfotransferase family protein [Acidiferrobacterales bacterium]
RDLSEMEEQWTSWFAQQQLEPLTIKYEDLSADPIGTIGTILERMGINRQHAEGIEIPVAKLANETNRLWAARFKSEWLE